jgi:hypothetical protein
LANLILKLKKNAETLEQELTVDYESDPDALPFEHEEEHRAIVGRLLVDAGEAGGNSLEIKRGILLEDGRLEDEPEFVAEQTPQKLRQ